MVRAVILGLVAIFAVASCKKGSDSDQVAANAAAGRVVEASGKVAATRDGKTRTLAVGNDVFRDDVVETGADGSLVIELAHNNARWAVEGNQRARVDESVAWGLAKQDKPAKVIDHATSAAGRDGERTAADTRASTDQAPAAATAEPARAEAQAVGQAKAPDHGAEPKVEPKEADPPKASKGAARDRDVAPGARAEPPPPPPPPPSSAPQLDTAADTGGGGGASDGEASGGKTRGGRVKSVDSIVKGKRAELVACAKGMALTVTVTVTKGKAKATLTGIGSASIKACIEQVVAAMEFAPINGTSTLDLKP